MTIDFHTHCFPDALAKRAMEALSYAAGGLEYGTDGTAAGLLASMDREGIDISVVQHIATNPHQQASVNRFARELNGDRLICFGSVHPDAEDAIDELDRIAAAGLRGVKFHPEYQNFFVDEQKMKPIYRKISELGLIVLFHAGEDLGFEPPYHCTPHRLRKALQMLDTPVVAAHWGGLEDSEGVLRELCGAEQLYLDLSFGYGAVPRKTAMRILDARGCDHILFGSDSPWHLPHMERRMLDTLELSAAERERIEWGNAAKLLDLPQN